MGEEIARLMRLVEAIHQLSVSDAAPVRGLGRQAIDLAGLVREVTAGMLPIFEVKRQEVALETAPTGVLGDRDALVQVLVNLLDNASKYAPEGALVRVGCAPSGGEAQITVANEGPGIAAEDLPHLFERF